MDYKNGKIYRAVSSNNKQYIGSTTQTLTKRLSTHKKDYKRWVAGTKRCGSIRELYNDESEVKIFLIEDYPCERKEQLEARERYWIENIEGGCVNKYIPTRSITEYAPLAKERDRERGKILKECECGSQVRQYSIKRHQTSKKHIKWINSF